VEHVVEDRLACGLLAQHTDPHRRAARAQRPAVYGVEDSELNRSERLGGTHRASL
jgi:hypothetical protein